MPELQATDKVSQRPKDKEKAMSKNKKLLIKDMHIASAILDDDIEKFLKLRQQFVDCGMVGALQAVNNCLMRIARKKKIDYYSL